VVLLFTYPQQQRRRSLRYPVPGGNDTLARQVLIGFQRVTLSPGQWTTVTFNVTLARLGDVAANGDVVLHAGTHVVAATNGHMPAHEQPRWEVAVDIPVTPSPSLVLKSLPASGSSPAAAAGR